MAIGSAGMGRGHAWFTGDGGLTWQARSSTPDLRVTEVPPLALARLLVFTGRPIDVAVYLPDGTTALLENPLNATIGAGWHTVIEGSDGSLWMPGTLPILNGRDRGRTWNPVPTPSLPLTPATGTAVTAYAAPDGSLMLGDFRNGVEYRLAPGADGFEPARSGQAQAFWGGRYWRSMGDPFEGDPPFYYSADGRQWTELRL